MKFYNIKDEYINYLKKNMMQKLQIIKRESGRM